MSPDPNVAPISVLMVDDRPENVAALKATLSSACYELVGVHSGREALLELLRRDFAVILLDVMMPGMDGFETARLIRGRDRSRDTPIVFLTANAADLDLIYRGYSVGAVDYLIKPIDPDIVRAKVKVFAELARRNNALVAQGEKLRQAEQELRVEESRRFLSEASQVLLSSLEYESNLERVARLAVPVLADSLVIDLSEDVDGPGPGGKAPRQPPEDLAMHRDLRATFPLRPGAPGLLLTDADALEPFCARSALIVPIRARGRVLGVISAIRHKLSYGANELGMAEDLAHRAAFAIENSALYREAQRAIRMRDEFLSVASHELRTPLTPLQIQLQRLLKSSEPLPPRFEPMLQSSERQVRRLTALVDHLLDVSRISSGRLVLSRVQLDLAELVREVATRFSDELIRVGCTLEVAADKAVLGFWDPLRIEQVLGNLLSNAVRYAAGSAVRVSLEDGGELVSLTVRDAGMGIPREKLGQIFGRFERAVSVRSHGGLGLGLYISKEIVEAHSGCISVESDLGAGATFRVDLPKQVGDRELLDIPTPEHRVGR